MPEARHNAEEPGVVSRANRQSAQWRPGARSLEQHVNISFRVEGWRVLVVESVCPPKLALDFRGRPPDRRGFLAGVQVGRSTTAHEPDRATPRRAAGGSTGRAQSSSQRSRVFWAAATRDRSRSDLWFKGREQVRREQGTSRGPSEPPPGFGLRQPSGALGGRQRSKAVEGHRSPRRCRASARFWRFMVAIRGFEIVDTFRGPARGCPARFRHRAVKAATAFSSRHVSRRPKAARMAALQFIVRMRDFDAVEALQRVFAGSTLRFPSSAGCPRLRTL